MIRRAFAVVFFLPSLGSAQFVRGTISDVETGARIGSANVRILTRGGRQVFGFVTDSTGEFRLPVPTGDSVHVLIERIGYAAVTSRAFALQRGQQLDVEVRLALQAVPVAPLKVLGRKRVDARLSEFYNRSMLNRSLGRGKIWTREDLEKHPPVMISHLLRTVPNRAAGACQGSMVYVDRLPVFDSADPDVDWNDIDLLVSPEDVEGIEVYRNPDIPYEYDHQLCQIMLVWRKPYGENGSRMTLGRLFMAIGFIGAIVLENRMF